MFKPGDFVVHKTEKGKMFGAHVFLVYSVGSLTNIDGSIEEIIEVRNPNFLSKLDNASIYSLYVEPK